MTLTVTVVAARSSVAEYPFATLTTHGATIPPPRGTHGERSADGGGTAGSSAGDGDDFVMAVKVVSILFLSVALVVTAFYVAIFVRRWKKKRGGFGSGHLVIRVTV